MPDCAKTPYGGGVSLKSRSALSPAANLYRRIEWRAGYELGLSTCSPVQRGEQMRDRVGQCRVPLALATMIGAVSCS